MEFLSFNSFIHLIQNVTKDPVFVFHFGGSFLSVFSTINAIGFTLRLSCLALT